MRCPKCGESYIRRMTEHIRQCDGCCHMFTISGSEWAETVADLCACDSCSVERRE